MAHFLIVTFPTKFFNTWLNQRATTQIFSDTHIYIMCEPYVDDLVVFSRERTDHIKNWFSKQRCINPNRNEETERYPADVFSWVHQCPVLNTRMSAPLYLLHELSTRSSQSVSFFDPFSFGTSHSWTRKGERTNSTKQL